MGYRSATDMLRGTEIGDPVTIPRRPEVGHRIPRGDARPRSASPQLFACVYQDAILDGVCGRWAGKRGF